MSRYQKIGLAILLAGVIAGSLFANTTYKAEYYFLSELNLDLAHSGMSGTIDQVHYACYIIGKRIFQLIVLAVLLRLFVLEVIAGILEFYGSFVFSAFLTFQLLQSGTSGLKQLFLAMFPQWIFYGVAIGYLIKGEQKRGENGAFRYYLLFLCLLLLGILNEIFINPNVMNW
jgi:hypothetical protein